MFLITHDLDTLYTITDRVIAVLSQKKVLVAGPWLRSSRPTTPGSTNTFTAHAGAQPNTAAASARQER